MKYNGIKLTEMTPEKWDGNRKFMLVWRFNNDTMPQQREVVEWYKNEHGYVIWRDVYNDYWHHCAEIPKEAQDTKYSIDDCIETIESFIDRSSISSWQDLYRKIITYLRSFKELKEENEKLKDKVKALNSSNYQTYCGMCNVIAKHEDKIADLKKKNEEFEEMIKSRDEYHKMADSESRSIKDGLVVKLSW